MVFEIICMFYLWCTFVVTDFIHFWIAATKWRSLDIMSCLWQCPAHLAQNAGFITPDLWLPDITDLNAVGHSTKVRDQCRSSCMRHLSTTQVTWNSASLTLDSISQKNIDKAVYQCKKQLHVSVYMRRWKTSFWTSAK